MTTDTATHQRIDQLVKGNRVVLFMKGTRAQPRCGFSAAASGALDSLLDDYVDVDVLADEAIRSGIKAYGNWPTIPQLYIDGELIGGTDIIQSMLNTGELHRVLGVPEPDRTPPTLSISEPAAKAIREALADAGEDKLHLAIDGQFQARFLLKPASGTELVTTVAGLEIFFDLASAQRARGLEIDWTETVQGAGLVIRNPNVPPPVEPMSVKELEAALAAGTITVIDVRPAADRLRVPFPPGADALDEDSHARLAALPKDTPLAFLCRVGNSSRSAAEHFRGLGFRKLYNVEGGIEAWSREVDAPGARY
jgi:monothiol glutaredoxin